jgi:hypothetical protein
MSRYATRLPLTLALLVAGLSVEPSTAAEIHSNGLGGGDWSDPLSWREKTVPTPDDDAVVSRGDVIAFDRNDEGKTSCKQLFVDPAGTFTFKTGAGRLVFAPSGRIESYGVILVDGSKSSADKLELRMSGKTLEERTVNVLKGGSFSVRGRRNLAHGKHNVMLTAVPVEKQPLLESLVYVEDGAICDVRGAEIVSLHLSTRDLDNTGAEAGERCNVVDNHFTGIAHLTVSVCDSPLIADNRFELTTVGAFGQSAMYVILCSLADIHGNHVQGRYAHGIQARQMIDSALVNCTFDDCASGIYWYGTNGMLKDCRARKCGTGVTCTSMTGVLENIEIDACTTGYSHTIATAQLNNVRVTNVPEKGTAISFHAGPLTLLNCEFKPEQIDFTNKAAAKAQDGVPVIQNFRYLVAKLDGKVTAGTQVAVRTAGRDPASRAADLNVRNSPARVGSNALTPLPDTLEALVVKDWSFDDELNLVPAPEYVLEVLPPAGSAGGSAAGSSEAATKPIASQTIKPDGSWYRKQPNDITPTVEIRLP